MEAYTYKAIKAYRERQKAKGYKYRNFMLSESESMIVKAFIQCLKNIDADKVESLDVSDDGLVFTIIIDGKG